MPGVCFWISLESALRIYLSAMLQVMLQLLPLVQGLGLHLEKKLKCSIKFNSKVRYHFTKISSTNITLFILDDVEFEVSSDRRTGKPIAVKLVKIKQEILPEERINGQVSDFGVYIFLGPWICLSFTLEKEDSPHLLSLHAREL